MPDKKGVLYIPRTIRLPGPYIVTVNQLAPMQMKNKHGEFYDGIWDSDAMVVDIVRKLDHKRKWWVYSHEFQHVVNDWVHWLVGEGIAKG